MKRIFELVAVGGTFDLLHKGHKTLFRRAFDLGDSVIIGLSTDDFIKQMKKRHEVTTYMERLRELIAFLRTSGVLDRAEILPLCDPYGVMLSMERIDAIVVSKDTEQQAHEINRQRSARGLSPLNIVVIELVQAQDKIPISTTRIRRKEIDREGKILTVK